MAGLALCVVFSSAQAGCVVIKNYNFVNTCSEQVIVVFDNQVIPSGNLEICKNETSSVCGFALLPGGQRTTENYQKVARRYSWVECVGDRFYVAKRDKYGKIQCFATDDLGSSGSSNSPQGNSRRSPTGKYILQGNEIRERIIGRNLGGAEPGGASVSLVYYSNGSLQMNRSGSIYHGSWEIRRDKLCTKWQSLGNGRFKCYRISQGSDGTFYTETGGRFWVTG